jgi:hypothetical protein
MCTLHKQMKSKIHWKGEQRMYYYDTKYEVKDAIEGMEITGANLKDDSLIIDFFDRSRLIVEIKDGKLSYRVCAD